MNCFNHSETVSVASCVDCGKGLCKECASLYALPICNECNAKRVKNDKNVISRKYIPSIIGAILGIVLTLWGNTFSSSSVGLTIITCIMFSFILAGIPWGWSIISFVQPKMFLFLSWFGWVLYFGIKFGISMFVGVVAMPIGIVRLTLKQKEASSKERNILNNMKK